MLTPEKLERVLSLINTGREAIGLPALLEIPMGVRGHFLECPLARAFAHPDASSVTVVMDVKFYRHQSPQYDIPKELATKLTNAEGWMGRTTTPNGVGALLPEELLEFRREFDNGRLPQFDISKDKKGDGQ